MGYSSGVLREAQRVIIYGAEGIGKSTFASKFPGAGFIDVNRGTGKLDVIRYNPTPESTEMLYYATSEMSRDPNIGTIVLDTAHDVVAIISKDMCARDQKSGIEAYGWKQGFSYLKEEIDKLINHLQSIVDAGTNIVLVEHCIKVKLDQPEGLNSYHRWQMNLHEKIDASFKQWADMVLFVKRDLYVVVDEKTKATTATSQSVPSIYTCWNACWDAKNRYKLDEKLPFDYSHIAHCIPDMRHNPQQAPVTSNPGSITNQAPLVTNNQQNVTEQAPELPFEPDNGILPELQQLMTADGISASQVQQAVYAIGIYPADMPVANYDEGFVRGRLVAKWSGVKKFIHDKGIK